MGRISHHLTGKDYKKTRQRQLDEQKILHLKIKEKQIQIQEDKEFLDYFKSNWRKELALGEGMTTADLTTTTLPATGDTVISQVDGYQSIFATNGGTLSGTDLSYSVRDTNSVRIITGANSTYSRAASTNFIDTRRITQVKFSVSKTAQPLGVDSWTDAGDGKSYNDNITVYMYISDYTPIEDSSVTFTSNATTGDYTFDIPELFRGRTDVQIGFQQFALASLPGEPTSGTAAATLYTPTFQRTVPVNVMVSLDDPEASSFIRTDSVMKGLSAQEKRKKLEDMLDAGNEYLLKQLGIQGSTARPADTRVVQSFMDIQVGDQRVTKTTYAPQKSSDSTSPSAEYQAARQETERAKARYDALKARASVTPTDLTQAKQDYEDASAREFTAMTGRQFNSNYKSPTPDSQPQTRLTASQRMEIDKQIRKAQSDARQSRQDARNNEMAANATKAALGLGALVGLGALGAYGLGLRGAGAAAQASRAAATQKSLNALKKAADLRKASKLRAARSMGQNVRGRGMGDRWSGPPQFNSYEPQGQVLSEKKLKSPKEVMSKIPGYYDDKPSPLGFPMEPPPKMVNGFHPDLVDGKKVADRFNRLDPVSARAMPLTGNPHIDKKVKSAAKKPK